MRFRGFVLLNNLFRSYVIFQSRLRLFRISDQSSDDTYNSRKFDHPLCCGRNPLDIVDSIY